MAALKSWKTGLRDTFSFDFHLDRDLACCRLSSLESHTRRKQVSEFDSLLNFEHCSQAVAAKRVDTPGDLLLDVTFWTENDAGKSVDTLLQNRTQNR